MTKVSISLVFSTVFAIIFVLLKSTMKKDVSLIRWCSSNVIKSLKGTTNKDREVKQELDPILTLLPKKPEV